MAGDMNLLGVALDARSNDSRAGWFGRGLSLEEPATPSQTPPPPGGCATQIWDGQLSRFCSSSGLVPAS